MNVGRAYKREDAHFWRNRSTLARRPAATDIGAIRELEKRGGGEKDFPKFPGSPVSASL